jgi:hypothetical protein
MESMSAFRRTCAAYLLAAFSLASLATVAAHHSLAGEYDQSKSITVTGIIRKVEWINPHPWIHIEARGPGGTVVTWTLSTPPIPMLRKGGLTREAILGKQGETVTAKALPSIDPRRRIGWLTSIQYQDGRLIQVSGR